MATGIELMQRPMSEAYVPPDTAPREPPVPLDGAPVDGGDGGGAGDTGQAHALVVVAKWRRQHTRCLRAAARGDLSLARQLRPADVWLEHSENSVPATAAWDWDLRPLELGLPAHPLPTSQVGTVSSPPQA